MFSPPRLQDANAPADVDIVILDVTESPAGGIAVSTRVTYPDATASSAPAVRLICNGMSRDLFW